MTLPATPDWFDLQPLVRWLTDQGQSSFAEQVVRRSAERLDQPTNGDLRRWIQTLPLLPDPQTRRLVYDTAGVRVESQGKSQNEGCDALRETLMQFHPWRKGPLEFLDFVIDTEWRSDWKWERIERAIDFGGKSVLDVGAGNGYYGWRMLASGASFVFGIDPILRFIFQFLVFDRYEHAPRRHFVVPMIDTDLPEKLSLFDVVVSAGVLYHRTSPIDHLRCLCGSLRPAGQLVLETLVIDDKDESVLVPEDRYAQMRNVWFLPSIAMLKRWMRRTGFDDICVVDVTATTTQEQRSTEWMTFQSLADFLAPDDPTKTIEGHPAPLRALLTARKVS